ncbi:MAG: S8 family serine peptidase [Elainellaceae cyanobacterium]
MSPDTPNITGFEAPTLFDPMGSVPVGSPGIVSSFRLPNQIAPVIDFDIGGPQLETMPTAIVPEREDEEAFALIGREQQTLIGIIDTGFDAEFAMNSDSLLFAGADWVEGDTDPLLSADPLAPVESDPLEDDHGTRILEMITAGEQPEAIWLGRAVGSGQWTSSLIEFVDASRVLGYGNAIATLGFDLVETQSDGTVVPRQSLTFDEQYAIEYARHHGVLLVVAAGNDGGPLSALAQSAQQFDNVLTVGAIDPTSIDPTSIDPSNAGAVEGLGQAAYSNFGDGLSLLASGEGPAESGKFGTSFAAARVADAIADLWETNPALSYRQVSEAVTTTAFDLATLGWDPETGYGQLNLEGAIAAVEGVDAEEVAYVSALIPTFEPVDLGLFTERSLGLSAPLETSLPISTDTEVADSLDPIPTSPVLTSAILPHLMLTDPVLTGSVLTGPMFTGLTFA